MKKTFQIVGKAVKGFFIVFCIFLGSLFFREQRLPRSWMERLSEMVSTDELVIRCDALFFGFRQGLRLSRVRVLGRNKPSVSEPILSAKSVLIEPLRRHVTAVDLRYPRLPESYYDDSGVYREKNERIDAELPEIDRFTLTLIRPDVLGVTPRKVQAEITCSPQRFDATDIILEWSDAERRMRLDGFTYVDLDEQRVYGEITGEARQSFIRPLLVALDVPVSLPYMDAFTGVTAPVPSFCSWDVNLMNNDFRLKLKLHPELGCYQSVPLRRADGEIGISVFTRGTNLNFRTTVGPIVALDAKNRSLSGTVDVQGANDCVTLSIAAQSDLPLTDTLSIIDYLNDGTLNCLSCETPPLVTANGQLAVEPERQDESCLTGRVAFVKGKFFDIPLTNASFDYAYLGSRVAFSNLRATGRDGGSVTGVAGIDLPTGNDSAGAFDLDLRYDKGSLAELSDVFTFDLGEKFGRVDGWVRLSAPLAENPYSGLNGQGSIRITDGKLAQMKLFAGLTEILAEKIPGFGSIVNQSQASADFTITNGVFASNSVLIEGGLVSVKAWGKYDIPRDNLDFTVRVQLLKNESLLGKLVHPVTWPFTKLLLEFAVQGPMDNPKWRYLSVIEKVLK